MRNRCHGVEKIHLDQVRVQNVKSKIVEAWSVGRKISFSSTTSSWTQNKRSAISSLSAEQVITDRPTDQWTDGRTYPFLEVVTHDLIKSAATSGYCSLDNDEFHFFK